jgi:hypothetical protein
VSDTPSGPPSLLTTTAEPIVVMAAGDIAGSSSSYHHEETSDLLVAEPGAIVFPLGDNEYTDGTLAQYNAYYHPWWGRVRSRTWPVPGNTEYHVAGAAGYFAYFASRAPAPYYAQDIGPWRWYFLNSELGSSGASATSPQARWLKADLAANPRSCVGASIHRPWLTSYGGDRIKHPPSTFLQPLAKILYDAGADLFLAGHQHMYERHMPTDASGAPKADGLRQFVVGTGGGGVAQTTPTTIARTSEKIILRTFGVLRLNLRATGYDFKFVPIAGSTATDAGSLECSGSTTTPPPPLPPPPPPSTITLTVTKKPDPTRSYALLDWTGASGDSVDVYRNAAFIKRTENDGHLGSTRSSSYEPITYTFQVCQKASTAVCSNKVSASFP